MKIDFDINNMNVNQIELLNCQVDLILRSLELYSHMYNYVYPRLGKRESKEEDLRISLVNDTYHQILSQYKNENFIPYRNQYYKGIETNVENSA